MGQFDSIVSESSQNIIIKNLHRQIKTRYPQKLHSNNVEKQKSLFSPECQYDSEFKCKNKPCGMATIHHSIQHQNHEDIRKLEKKRI